MDWTVATYVAYLALTIPLIVWVATTLSRNGEVFLADVLAGNEQLAAAVNRLLVVGFYLLNLGLLSLFLRIGDEVTDLGGLFDTLSWKIGAATLTLGVLHFGNVYAFNAIRRRTRIENARLASGPATGPLQHPVPYPGR